MLSFCEICDLRDLVEIKLEKEFEMAKLFNGKKTQEIYQKSFNYFFELYVKLSEEGNIKIKEKYVEMHREINLREAK